MCLIIKTAAAVLAGKSGLRLLERLDRNQQPEYSYRL